MAKALIVVESPAKVKTIKKYLGSDYEVVSSVGHIKDLPKSTLGIDVEHDFETVYQVLEKKKDVVAALKKAAKGLLDIYIATDPDREGEAIAWHIAEEIGAPNKNIHRVLFSDLTKQTVLYSLAHPSSLDFCQYEAQQTRRVLDRLVGYKISPLLWSKVRRGLSAGRVQSVAVRIICEREEAINRFVAQEYWNITAMLAAQNPPPFAAKLIKVGGKKASIATEAQALAVIEKIKSASPFVEAVVKKEVSKSPPPPFTTSKLQQEAARWLHFNTKRTMNIAQRLYEGIELGQEGSVALITYMRTDSVRTAASAIEAVREYILEKHGSKFLPEKARHFQNSARAQDAHEAIRPTSLSYSPASIKKHLSNDEFRLYQLIWDRFVASQMSAAVYEQTTIDVQAAECLLRASGSLLKFGGFTVVYTEGRDDNGEEDEFSKPLPDVSPKEPLELLDVQGEQKFTQPPPRFSEAALVRELEENGIGRPSTYANILSTIQEREYVKIEQGRFCPTELGEVVNKLLIESFSRIMDVKFTAAMEETLDKIAAGTAQRLATLRDFYGDFQNELQLAAQKMAALKGEGEATDIICDKCGSQMVIKFGKNGRFLACVNYPECKNTADFTRTEGGKVMIAASGTSEHICNKCGRQMVVKNGKFGKFLACEGYPECKNTMNLNGAEQGEASAPDAPLCPLCGKEMLQKRGRFGRFWGCPDYPTCKAILPVSTGLPCPRDGCNGNLTERTSARGKVFYSCSNYPQCKFATWYKPLGEECPDCGKKSLAEKRSARGGITTVCINENCPSQSKSPHPRSSKAKSDKSNPHAAAAKDVGTPAKTAKKTTIKRRKVGE